MSSVSLRNITKSYPNGFKAVDGFTLDIADGEFVVFVGPSGCGKSTTLRLIAGLEEEFQGEIRIGDRVVNGVEPKDRDIAMVFQNYALYPHMTAFKNMALALELRRVPRDRVAAKVTEAARMLGIEHLLDRKPGQLSGGQRQRVALGRAIVREPKAFLFDEPLSNLDAKLRVSTRAELKALHQRLRTTSIYVTHDQEEAMTLGDRIVVMSGGRIQQAASPLEVYRRPANRFVAGFVGTPPMNFIEGSVAADSAAFTTADGSVRLSLPAAMRSHAGKAVVAGVRPQHWSLAPSGVQARVETVEFIGEQIDVHAAAGGGTHRLLVRVPASAALQPGQAVTLTARPEDVLLFEPGDFGRNLTLGV